ncbi:MAG: LytR/AlgR family response regulator transcription factor [Saprospiraceae bacterium]
MSIIAIKNNIHELLNRPFTLLDSTKDRLFLIIFCAFFSTFFLYFYQPLNITTWQHDSTIGNFLTIWSAGFLGALVLCITQLIIRPTVNLTTFTVGQFLLWVFFEFLLLAILFSALYGEWKNPFWQEFLLTLRYTISLTIIPYFLACLLIAVRKLSNPVKVEASPTKPTPKPILPLAQYSFKDENGKIMLAIKPMQLLLLKSENNYTAVFFLQNEKVEKKLIRTNLKKLESELCEFPYLLRIHRSYMVNLKKIASVERKKGSFQIHLTQLPEMPLKVSESYKAIFEEQIK